MKIWKWVVALVGSALIAGSTYGCGGGGGGGGGGAAPPGGGTAPLTSGNAQWTFMVYVTANGDLAQAQLASLKALESVGSTPDVHFVVQAKTSSVEYDENGQAKAVDPAYQGNVFGSQRDNRPKRWLVQRDPSFSSNTATGAGAGYLPPKITSTIHAADVLGASLDSTAPATLGDFVAWTKTNYPARRYALVLCDHGGNWTGFGVDHAVPQLDLAHTRLDDLVGAASTVLGRRLDLLGFDACIMAGVEVMTALSDSAKVMVASEDLETLGPTVYGVNGGSWNYTQIASALTSAPSMTERTLGTQIVDLTGALWNTGLVRTPCSTLSALDLDQTTQLVNAFQRFSAARLAGLATELDALGQARMEADDYAPAPGLASGAYVDLKSFAERFQARIPDQASADLVAAVDRAVIRNTSGALRPRSTGITLHMPMGQNLTLSTVGDQDYATTAFAQATDWDAVLFGLFRYMTIDTVDPVVQMSAPSAAVLGPGAVVSAGFSVTGTDVTQISRILFRLNANGTEFQYVGDLDTGLSGTVAGTVNWDGNTFVVTDGTAWDFLDVTPVRSGLNLYRSTWRGPNGKDVFPLLEIDRVTGQSRIVGVYLQGGDGILLQVPLDVLPFVMGGSSFRTVTRRFDANGNVTQVAGAVSFTLSPSSPLSVAPMRVPAGNYIVALRASDFAGNQGQAQFAVTVP